MHNRGGSVLVTLANVRHAFLEWERIAGVESWGPRVQMIEKGLAELIHELTNRDIRHKFNRDSATRIVSQKVLYLLQSSGLLLSPSYEFEFHFSGPHSPYWAQLGHEIASGGQDQIMQVSEDYTAIKGIIGQGSMTWLVAVATCHWYHCVEGLGRNAAKKAATEEKRHRALLHFDDAWDLLERTDWLRGHLPHGSKADQPAR